MSIFPWKYPYLYIKWQKGHCLHVSNQVETKCWYMKEQSKTEEKPEFHRSRDRIAKKCSDMSIQTQVLASLCCGMEMWKPHPNSKMDCSGDEKLAGSHSGEAHSPHKDSNASEVLINSWKESHFFFFDECVWLNLIGPGMFSFFLI